jgi:hypothetical protein
VIIVDSRATTGLPEATASLTSGLTWTRELKCRVFGISLAVRHIGRIIQNLLDPTTERFEPGRPIETVGSFLIAVSVTLEDFYVNSSN